MTRTHVWKLAAVFTLALSALGQTSQPTILLLDIENWVQYLDDISDVSKFATNPNVTPSVNFRDFSVATVLGDIVAVNGQPAKGLYAARVRTIRATRAPNPGQAIADVQRTPIREVIYEILKADSTPVGTIVALGLSGGPPPPAFAIAGGTGAFLGVRGVAGPANNSQGVPIRAASMAEDPANRRINGGGRGRVKVQVIPMFVPQILTTAAGPAVTHSSDSTPVTHSKPASSGEVLSLVATGLGPTRPGVDPGQPFPSSPEAVVNSPVEVAVNGKPAEVLGAGGFPGAG